MTLTADQLRKSVQTKDWKITYYEAGAEHDRVVLLLHGSGPGATGWSNFAPNIEPLAERLHVYAVDMPGWGDSDAVTVDQLDHVEAAVQFLDALGIEKAALVGNSMGGHTALRFATVHPDRISHLVTMGSPHGRVPTLFGPGDGPSEGLKILAAAYADPSPESMRRLVEIMTFDKERFATPELTKARSDAALAQPDHLENWLAGRSKGGPVPVWVDQAKLPDIAVPTLLIHGRDDRVLTYESTLQLLARIPDSTAVIFNRCGHWAQIEHAERFNRLVTDFVLND
jgi:2-hydroxy-6-oxonona-2,4-dienedioate hydrolase